MRRDDNTVEVVRYAARRGIVHEIAVPPAIRFKGCELQFGLSLLLVAVSLGATQSPVRSFRWWLDADVQRDLALTRAQVTLLQGEYDKTLERRRRLRRALDEASAELTRALNRGDLSDDAAETLIGRVEGIRRQRNVARTRLLVAMYFLLTREQRSRLREILERANISATSPC